MEMFSAKVGAIPLGYQRKIALDRAWDSFNRN